MKKKYFAQCKKKKIRTSQMWASPRGGTSQKIELDIKLLGEL